MATTTITERPVSTVRTIAMRGGLALVTAVLAVVIVRGIAGALLAIPAGFDPMVWGTIVGFTAFAAIVATIVYALVDRFTARPVRNFLAVAALVFLGMMVPLLTVAPTFTGATTTLLAVLFVLHVVVAVGITVPLVRGTAVLR